MILGNLKKMKVLNGFVEDGAKAIADCDVRNKHYAVLVDGNKLYTGINKYSQDINGYHTTTHAEQYVIAQWLREGKDCPQER